MSGSGRSDELGEAQGYVWLGEARLDAPPPEQWPTYDVPELVGLLDELLAFHGFKRAPTLLAAVDDAGDAASVAASRRAGDVRGRMVAVWDRLRDYPDADEGARSDQESYTFDSVVIWGNQRVTFDVLGHRAVFDRWPAAWTRAAIAAVLDHVGPGTGPR